MPDCALHPDYRHCTGRQIAVDTGVLFQVLFLSMIVCGCTGVPEGIFPVKAFDLDRYLGTWYEIARLDHSFERGLDDVSAEYSLRDDGGVRVINRGFLVAEDTWKEAEGKAYFAGAPDEGYLKVSFIGPFYGSSYRRPLCQLECTRYSSQSGCRPWTHILVFACWLTH
jgi:lipocalin